MDEKQILINLYNGSSILRKVNINTKIKNFIEDNNIKNSYLSFNGKILNSKKNFLDYKIDNNDILFVNKRLKGGIFSTIIKALVKIVEFFILILKYLDDFIMIFIKLIEIIPLIFNPKKFIDDLIFGISYSIKLVVGGMMDSIDSGTVSNKEENPDDVPKVCMPPSLFNLIILLICPPLALMIHVGGVKGIFLTVICAILTVWCYYFPGFIFAAIHILC
jgi:hypothetical protein